MIVDPVADGGKRPPVVVKIGGSRIENPEGAISDIAHLVANGRRVVVVHGGSTVVDTLLTDLGRDPEYVETPEGVTGRFTDNQTMEVFEMALPGKLNTELVTEFRHAGVNAFGLSGVDGGLVTGTRKSAVRVVEDGTEKIKRGDHAGKPETVNLHVLETLIDSGYVPVISPPMLADDGAAVNTDADRMAAVVAGAVGANLVVLTDVEGVRADPNDASTLIKAATTPTELAELREVAEGSMTRKVMAATEALENGTKEVIISDADLRDPVVAALNGAGTRVERSALSEENDRK